MTTSPILDAVIVGSGFSGLCMGIQLKQAGKNAFAILEKEDNLGGTWRDNIYPGAACDIPSHLYSYSFEPNPRWSRTYSPYNEIWFYLKHCADKYGINPHIHYGHKVKGAAFDAESGLWTVQVEGHPDLQARALVLGNGALHLPQIPDIQGLNRFRGKMFHSARWDKHYDLRGKNVGVIGTGASAIQFVPEIAPLCAKVHLYQRTPPWILPKADRAYSELERQAFERVPGLRHLLRSGLFWLHELRGIGMMRSKSSMMDLGERMAKRYLESAVRDPGLRAKLTPNYRIGCKRVLLSNNYYEALQRPNVELITDSIKYVTEEGIASADGCERKLDTIILGTGFQVADYLAPFHIRGKRGQDLNETLQSKRESYYGITINGFPNLFLLMGPNTGLGHNSIIFMIEAQVRYAMQALGALDEKRLRYLDVREEVQHTFAQRIQEQLSHTVWNTGGCSSWYLKDGHNMTLWPGFCYEYWLQTRTFRAGDYEQAA